MFRRCAIPGGFTVAALLVAVAVVASGCSGDSSEASTPPAPESVIEVPLGEIVVESAGSAGTLSPEVAEALRGAVEAYVTDGVVATLRTGEPGDLSAVFDPAALATLETPEGAPLLDRGAPIVSGDVRAIAEPLTLTVLADESGNAVLIAASLLLVVEAATDGGDLTITRVADLTFAPSGDGWLVTNYKASVFRVGDERGAAADAGEDAGGGSEPTNRGTEGTDDSDGDGS